MISILSYNILLGRKLEKILEWLKEQEPFDIICLQEFPEKKIPLILKELSAYDYEFTPSISRKKEEFGQITLFNKGKFTLKKKLIINIGPSIVSRTLHKNNLDRNILITVFGYNSFTFLVANVHLTPLTWNTRKINQLQKMLELLDNIPTIITGDFNYSSLMNLKRLTEFLKTHGFTHDTPGIITHKAYIIRQQLDYIFSKRLTIRDVEVKKIRFSDHFPISANIFV